MLGEPIAVAASPDGTSLYVGARSASGYAIVMFARNPSTGGLAAIGCIGETGENPGCAETARGLHGLHSLAMSADGESLYAYGDAIVHFQRDPGTGALTPIDCVGQLGNNQAGCARTARGLGRTDIPLSSDIVVSSDGVSVYAVGDEAILRLNRDPTTGSLKPIGCIGYAANNPAACPKAVPVLNGPQDLALTDDGRSLYVTAPGDLALVHFQRASTGALSYFGCVGDPSSQAGCPKKARALFAPTAVAVSADGRSVYVGSMGPDAAVVRLARATNDGSLTAKGCIGTDADAQCASNPGDLDRPVTLAVSADGKSLYAAGESDVVWFDRSKSGALTQEGCVGDATSNPFACVQVAKGVDQSASLAISPSGNSLYDGSETALVRFGRSP